MRNKIDTDDTSILLRRLAHDLKNPLTPIQLIAERIKRRLVQLNIKDDDIELMLTTQIRQVNDIARQLDAIRYLGRNPKRAKTFDVTTLERIVREELDDAIASGHVRRVQILTRWQDCLNSSVHLVEEAFRYVVRELSILATERRNREELAILLSNDGARSIALQIYMARTGQPHPTIEYLNNRPGFLIITQIIKSHAWEFRILSGDTFSFCLNVPFDPDAGQVN